MKHIAIDTSYGPVGALLWDRDSSETVVLVHGLFDSAYTWKSVAEKIPFRTVALDLPGFGMSHVPARGSFGVYAEAIMEAVRKLDIKSFHLVGHSFGGAVASEMAHRNQAGVRSLFLVAPAGYGPFRFLDLISLAPIRKSSAFLAKQITGNKLATDFAYTYFVRYGQQLDQETLDHLTDLGKQRQEGIARALETLAGYDKKNTLPDNFYKGPALFLWGEDDRRIPEKHIDRLLQVLPNGDLVVWSGVGHHPQHEREDDFLGLLDDLIRRGGES